MAILTHLVVNPLAKLHLKILRNLATRLDIYARQRNCCSCHGRNMLFCLFEEFFEGSIAVMSFCFR